MKQPQNRKAVLELTGARLRLVCSMLQVGAVPCRSTSQAKQRQTPRVEVTWPLGDSKLWSRV